MTRSDMRQMLLDWLDDNYHFGDAPTLIPSDDAARVGDVP